MKFLKKLYSKNKTSKSAPPKSCLISDDSPFYIKEAYKSLRTNIMFTLENEKSKAIVITSSLSGEGKSNVSINTAITFAQTGSKVILVDCDLRKPKMHSYLKVSNKIGLSNVLGGFAKIEDVITNTEYGFDCIPSGHIPPNPSELLSSSKMADFISTLREKYDYIFLDTPPVNPIIDTCTLGKLVDGAIFVVKFNSTTYTDIDVAMSALKFSETNVLGFVFNCLSTKKTLAYQKRGYRRKYGYYSKRRYGYGGYYGGNYYSYGYYGNANRNSLKPNENKSEN